MDTLKLIASRAADVPGAIVGWVINKWETEPLAVTALIDGVVVFAVTFGAPITPEQKAALDTVLAAIGVLVARNQVSPVNA